MAVNHQTRFQLIEHLRGIRRSSDNDTFSAVNEWFEEVGETFFRDVFEMLEHH